MRIECHSREGHTRKRHGVTRQTAQDEPDPWDKKEPPRAVHKKEAHCAPSVPKSPEVRSVTPATIRMQNNRHFGHPRLEEASLDNHLGCKLHPGAALTEAFIRFLREAP